jgi:hypothetical protein
MPGGKIGIEIGDKVYHRLVLDPPRWSALLSPAAKTTSVGTKRSTPAFSGEAVTFAYCTFPPRGSRQRVLI